MDLSGTAFRTVSFTSPSQRRRVRASRKARYSLATGAANTLLLPASNSPLRRWPTARRPVIRSYPTVTHCAHHPEIPYFSRTCWAMARWDQSCAPAWSSAPTQRAQLHPVFASMVASLILASCA